MPAVAGASAFPGIPSEPMARPGPPPSPPRPISAGYVWRIMLAEAWGIIGLVFALIGTIFTCVGLTAVMSRNGVPLILALLGLAFAVPGWALLVWRFQHARKVVEALRVGDTAEGQITEVSEDYSTTINGAHPWIIRYAFNANGSTYNGDVRTLTFAGYQYRAGMPAWVLYLRRQPDYNSLYPHP